MSTKICHTNVGVELYAKQSQLLRKLHSGATLCWSLRSRAVPNRPLMVSHLQALSSAMFAGGVNGEPSSFHVSQCSHLFLSLSHTLIIRLYC
jgi:hypothetical protein